MYTGKIFVHTHIVRKLYQSRLVYLTAMYTGKILVHTHIVQKLYQSRLVLQSSVWKIMHMYFIWYNCNTSCFVRKRPALIS